MDYNTIPTVVFSHPAIGTVGLTERRSNFQYGKDNVKVYTSAFTSMYTALEKHRQMAKFKLVTAGENSRFVGLHGMGYGVDEMIQGFAVAIKMRGATKEEFDAVVAIHLQDQKNLLPCVNSKKSRQGRFDPCLDFFLRVK